MEVDIVDCITQKALPGKSAILFVGIGQFSNQRSQAQNQKHNTKDIGVKEMF